MPPGVAACGVEVRDPERAAAVLRAAGAGVEGPGPRAVPRRHAEFLAGRWCARRALAAVGGQGPVGRADGGAPEWPRGFVGSITHADGRVLAVAARADDHASVGVDVERVVSDATAAELRARVLTASEHALLVDVFGDPTAAFTAAFSAKEALYKCLYPVARRFVDFDAARVVAADARALTLELAIDWAPALGAGRRFEAHHARTATRVETLVVLAPDPRTVR
jgi:enterobactin synthetase component D